jgi:hypothetical protein
VEFVFNPVTHFSVEVHYMLPRCAFSNRVSRACFQSVVNSRATRLSRPNITPHLTFRNISTTASKMVKNFGDDEQRAEDPKAHEVKMDAESVIQRNPHPDFKKVEGMRPDWQSERNWEWTKTKEPSWKPGHGANDGGESLKKKHVEIDPYAEGRPAAFNYKLLISAIVPRFIGFVSTISADGKWHFRPQDKPKTLTMKRKIHQPCAVQLHDSGQPRPTNLCSRICWRHR